MLWMIEVGVIEVGDSFASFYSELIEREYDLTLRGMWLLRIISYTARFNVH